MKLRVCNGQRERVVPASIELVEEVFGGNAPLSEGAEIALSDGERWIAAIAMGQPAESDAEFLLSGVTGDVVPPAGRVSRGEALRRFREFVLS